MLWVSKNKSITENETNPKAKPNAIAAFCSR